MRYEAAESLSIVDEAVRGPFEPWGAIGDAAGLPAEGRAVERLLEMLDGV